ncbi:LysR family transcriptional regulator [Microbacterium sp. NPDC056044]|uniref:LysR family transcriptional regulator n=1 Tax=Microbacterium sp. NPDC056044 TaxID=3345690 RepID=UPI0035DC0B59
MMRIEAIRTLVAVYDNMSVVGAARERGYSASAVSRQMAELQRQLGVVLFKADGRGISPTRHASGLVAQAREVLAPLDRLEQYAKRLRDVTQLADDAERVGDP